MTEVDTGDNASPPPRGAGGQDGAADGQSPAVAPRKRRSRSPSKRAGPGAGAGASVGDQQQQSAAKMIRAAAKAAESLGVVVCWQGTLKQQVARLRGRVDDVGAGATASAGGGIDVNGVAMPPLALPERRTGSPTRATDSPSLPAVAARYGSPSGGGDGTMTSPAVGSDSEAETGRVSRASRRRGGRSRTTSPSGRAAEVGGGHGGALTGRSRVSRVSRVSRSPSRRGSKATLEEQQQAALDGGVVLLAPVPVPASGGVSTPYQKHPTSPLQPEEARVVEAVVSTVRARAERRGSHGFAGAGSGGGGSGGGNGSGSGGGSGGGRAGFDICALLPPVDRRLDWSAVVSHSPSARTPSAAVVPQVVTARKDDAVRSPARQLQPIVGSPNRRSGGDSPSAWSPNRRGNGGGASGGSGDVGVSLPRRVLLASAAAAFRESGPQSPPSALFGGAHSPLRAVRSEANLGVGGASSPQHAPQLRVRVGPAKALRSPSPTTLAPVATPTLVASPAESPVSRSRSQQQQSQSQQQRQQRQQQPALLDAVPAVDPVELAVSRRTASS